MKRLLFICAITLLSLMSVSQDNKTQLTEMINKSRQLRQMMQSDPHRPIYHFVNPEGHAMPFDPNGGIFWNGKYHLGYIYQFLANGKSEHFWGHAVSTDLFHWTLYPDMLNVKQGDIEKGIFSGGAFLSKKVFLILCTMVRVHLLIWWHIQLTRILRFGKNLKETPF